MVCGAVKCLLISNSVLWFSVMICSYQDFFDIDVKMKSALIVHII